MYVTSTVIRFKAFPNAFCPYLFYSRLVLLYFIGILIYVDPVESFYLTGTGGGGSFIQFGCVSDFHGRLDICTVVFMIVDTSLHSHQRNHFGSFDVEFVDGWCVCVWLSPWTVSKIHALPTFNACKRREEMVCSIWKNEYEQ